jgi:hypothetical protein
MKIRNVYGRELELSETTISQIEQLTCRSIYRILSEANVRENRLDLWEIVEDDPGGAKALMDANDEIVQEILNNLPWYRRLAYRLLGMSGLPRLLYHHYFYQ